MTSIASTRRHAITSGSSNLCRSATHVVCGTQRAPRPGAAAMTDIPHDHLGQPDLQALGDLSVGH
jgi:hypothetical protein